MKNMMLKLKNFFVEKAIKYSKMILNRFSAKNVNSSYSSLMPKNDADISNYESTLNYVFHSPEKIKNIALSGSYGSGKSTIIETYEKKHPELKFIHISLAHFNDEYDPLKNTNNIPKQTMEGNGYTACCAKPSIKINKKEISNLLEGKILNQLIHQINPDKIPESNFNIKHSLSLWKKFILISSMFIFCMAVIYLVFYKNWMWTLQNIKVPFLQFTLTSEFKIILTIICTAIILFMVKSFINKSGLFRQLKKIEIKNLVGIEIFDSSTDSSFDRYLNEVVYLFEKSTADAIVFEDLDRYETLLIFEKLREINYLVNINAKKTIRFFYLIKDDIFTSTDRSKFFDFIIPVVPVVDITNSSGMLLKLLKNAGLSGDVNKQLINDLSFYIDDMRLLTNIVNEYQVYKKVIKMMPDHENSSNQFAMIVYKNLFPKDFHALQSGCGYVYTVFKQKEKLCEKKEKALVAKKNQIVEDIKISEKSILKNIDELNAIYFPLNEQVLQIDDEEINQEIDRVELIRKIINSTKSVYVRDGYSKKLLVVQDLITKMTEMAEYQARFNEIQLLSVEAKEELEKTIKKISNEIDLLSTKRLKEFISSDEESSIFWKEVNEVYKSNNEDMSSILTDRNYELIKYLILHGYLNENYEVYCSYFYSNDLSLRDRNFIMSVYNGKKIAPNYILESPKKVLENINPSSFMLEYVNNYTLLKYVIENRREDLLKTWFLTLENNSENGYDFIIDFWRMNKKNEDLLNYIIKIFPSWIKKWYIIKTITEDELYELIFEIVDICPEGTIAKINLDNWLTTKISNDSKFLSHHSINDKKYCKELKNINVLFTTLECPMPNEYVLKFVYDNNMYVINMQNIFTVVNNYTKFDLNSNMDRFFTFLLKNNDKPVSKYLLENINQFIPLMVEVLNKKFKDDQNTILFILNNSSIDNANKILYMLNSSIKVNVLSAIQDKMLWPELLKISAFSNSWKNLAIYYDSIESEEEVISEELSVAMSNAKGLSILNFKKLNNLLTQSKASIFRRNFIKSIFFDNADYKRILKAMGFNYPAFSISDLLHWQLIVLLETNIIAKTKENFDFIKQNYSKNLLDFILIGDSKKVFKLIQDGVIILEKTEILELLSDERITNEFSLILLGVYSGTITIENKNYTDEVCEEIIQNHFSVDDLPWLLRNYDSLGEKTKAVLLEYSTKNMSRVISVAKANKILPVPIFASLLELDSIDLQTILDLRKILSDKRFELVCTSSKSPSFEYTQYNITILEYFKEQGWISSYSVVNDKLRAYPKRKAS